MAESTNRPIAQSGTQGPKYFINIEGADYEWGEASITSAGLRQIAGWSADQPVDEIDLATNSRTPLSDSDVIELKPGHGFAKKIEFDRGVVQPSGAHAVS